MIISTENKNSYFLSQYIPQILLLHPVLEFLISMHINGKNVDEAVREFNDDFILINNKKIMTNIKELQYYLEYFHFLRANNYFNERKTFQLEDTRKYDSSKVEFNLANTDQISFEVTDACNLDCRYCGYGELYSGYDPRRGLKMEFKTAKEIIDYVISLKKKFYSQIKTHKKIAVSFYGGEPLLNFPLIFKIVNYVKTLQLENFNFLFTMTTNGILLNKYRDFLVGNKFVLLVSLDGNEKHNGYRIFPNGDESFNTVFNNIQEIKKKNPSYFQKYVFFNSVLHDKNSYWEVKEFFDKIIGTTTRFGALSQIGIKPEKKAEFEKMMKTTKTESELKEMEMFFKKNPLNSNMPSDQNVENIVKQYSGYFYNCINQLLGDPERVSIVNTGTCHPFEKKIFVTVKGKLIPCEKIPQYYDMGRLRGDKIELDFQEIAEKYNEYYKKMSALCSTCYNKFQCSRCIFYNFEGTNVKCQGFLNNKEYQKNLVHAMTLLESVPLYYYLVKKNLFGKGAN